VDRRFPITCAVHPSENRYKSGGICVRSLVDRFRQREA
jgi:hypothetical protein